MRRGITFRLVGEPELNEDEVQLARSAFARGHEVTSLLLGRQKKREEKADEDEPRARRRAEAVDYHRAETIFDALDGSRDAVKLLSARWLCAFATSAEKRRKSHSKGPTTLPKRNDAKADIFIEPWELRSMYEKAAPMQRDKNMPPRLPIVAISQIWQPDLSEAAVADEDEEYVDIGGRDPDPNGTTLAMIAKALRERLRAFSKFGYKDVGVYLNWSCCYQPPRSLHEVGAHMRAEKLCALWFTHKLTTVFLCHNTPPPPPSAKTTTTTTTTTTTKDAPALTFHERGWNAFEAACTWLLKEPHDEVRDVMHFEKNVRSDHDDEKGGATTLEWPLVVELRENAPDVKPKVRPPPPGLDAFDEGIGVHGSAFFQNEPDRAVVAERFRCVLRDALGGTTSQSYASNDFGDDAMRQLDSIMVLHTRLEQLDLSRNAAIIELPASLGQAKALRSLFLVGCEGLLTLPESIGQCTRLRSLHLAGCSSLTHLPDSLGLCTEVIHLDASRCTSLIALPESLGELTQLNDLFLGGCRSLIKLPERLPKLVELFASGCASLRTLPVRISGAPPSLLLSPRSGGVGGGVHSSHIPPMDLHIHGINHNPMRALLLYGAASLEALPDDIGRLKSLAHLDLGRCISLVTLPESLKKLDLLKYLNLQSCTSLTHLPPIGALKSLEVLDLRDCTKLEALPQGLAALTEEAGRAWGGKLVEVKLDGCTTLPSAVRMTSARPHGFVLDERWTERGAAAVAVAAARDDDEGAAAARDDQKMKRHVILKRDKWDRGDADMEMVESAIHVRLKAQAAQVGGPMTIHEKVAAIAESTGTGPGGVATLQDKLQGLRG